jgi:predicted DNA-binding transcriptional regulator AlpA
MSSTITDSMTWRELADALKLKQSTFYKYKKAGRFERFELVPRIGPRRYSRAKVEQYLDREDPKHGLALAKKTG